MFAGKALLIIGGTGSFLRVFSVEAVKKNVLGTDIHVMSIVLYYSLIDEDAEDVIAAAKKVVAYYKK